MTHKEAMIRRYEAFFQLLLVQDINKFKILYAYLINKKNVQKICTTAKDCFREKARNKRL